MPSTGRPLTLSCGARAATGAAGAARATHGATAGTRLTATRATHGATTTCATRGSGTARVTGRPHATSRARATAQAPSTPRPARLCKDERRGDTEHGKSQDHHLRRCAVHSLPPSLVIGIVPRGVTFQPPTAWV